MNVEEQGNPIEEQEVLQEEVEETSAEETSEQPFYKTIEAITNIQIEGEFDETLEGYAEREVKVYERGKVDAIQVLREQHPDIYELLEYKEAGGNPLELLQKKGAVRTEVNSEDEAKIVVTQYLQSMGMDDDDIEAQIERFEDTGKLEAKAREFLTKQADMQDKVYKAELEKQKQYAEYLEQDKVKAVNAIVQQIDKGAVGSFIISQNDKEEYKSFVLNSMTQQPDGKYYIWREVDVTNMEQDLMTEYLRFKKGSLKEIVQRQAKTENIKALKSRLQTNGATKAEITEDIWAKIDKGLLNKNK